MLRKTAKNEANEKILQKQKADQTDADQDGITFETPDQNQKLA